MELKEGHILTLAGKVTDNMTLNCLGIALGLDTSEIRAILTNCPGNITEASLNALRKWRDTQSDRRSACTTLIEALRRAGLNLYVNDIFTCN